MKLTLNNRSESINTSKEIITVSELLAIQKFSYKMLIVRINDFVVKTENYSTTTIKDGDNVQVIHLISGG
ncbi:MAG TPA: thiamine biosynthesis protein ThiS [Bacteroidetes bacterium]|nr:thiamine biosynthesis protein ThiS [Bacteroidota bacterium]